MNKIQTSLGFCPQHDILYDDLNVQEHLMLIAMVKLFFFIHSTIIFIKFNLKIKGFPNEVIKSEVVRISSFVGLNNDLRTKSKNLSGGMKRRLSVAMSFIGDSKVIILGNLNVFC
jgi:ABC-type multidrug transport system ATPase subunit